MQHLPWEIISADSALVYRGLDIGTAKPTSTQLAAAPHRLIDICDPSFIYSVGDFRRDALHEIEDIHRRGKVPLLVGGSMLYFWALQNGLASLPTADSICRAKISAQASELGWPALHQQLSQIDSLAAARIHPQDGQRIQRALEVYYSTGQTITHWQYQFTKRLPYKVVNIILAPEKRESLQQRIVLRLQRLLALGFIDEVQNLRQRNDLNANLPALRTVGYRQIWEYLENPYPITTLINQIQVATAQLAKRQMTWLRRWKQATWLTMEAPHKELIQQIQSALQIV